MAAEDQRAFTDAIFSATYEELRRAAYRLKRGRGNLTLNPTALVHEAYLKLLTAKGFHAASPEHLKYTIVRAMRHLLLDAARRQAAECRGGGQMPIRRIALDEHAAQSSAFDPSEVLAVGLALDRLAMESELEARAFECQFFGGLQVSEIAEVLGVSEKKVQRLLRMARASLIAALECQAKPEGEGR